MKLVDLLTKDIFLKLLSLAFAVLLWFFVVLEDKVEQVLTVHVKVKHLPKNLVLVKPPPRTITVYVTGPRSILRTIRRPLKFKLDLEDYKPGRYIISLSERKIKRKIKLPAGLKVIKIDPKQFEIVLEKEVEKVVPVEVGIYGSPPQGWKVVKIEVIPDKVKVYGPQSIISRLRRVRTVPIDINELTGSVKKRVPLDLPDLVKVKGDNTVEVHIKVAEHIVTREIKDLPLIVKGAKSNIEYSTKKVTTILQGPERLVGPFANLKIEAYIDVRGLKPGVHKVKVQIDLPPGVKLLKVEPREVEVKILEK